MNNTQFYNAFAEEYNAMIPLEKQVESKEEFFEKFITDEIKTAADLGAGSGADSIALYKLGLNVVAFEPSEEMVKQAQHNFSDQKVNVEIFNRKLIEIDAALHDHFDLVVSMGNTFANIGRDEIETSIKKLIALMKPGGKAIIQILNYDKVLSEQERIVNITESNSKQFIRFYDFCEEKVFFNILSFQKDDFSTRKLITTEIFPYTKTLLEKLFQQNGIKKLEFFGDIKLSNFEKSTSPNLIVKVEK